MAWGRAAAGSGSQFDDWLRKLRANDQTLTNLYILSFRKLSREEYRKIFDALHDNVSLKAFHSGHAIADLELAALAEALARNKGLESLSVGDRSLGDEGVATLCGGLRENHSLVKLDLDNKGVGYEGCMALGQLLGHHPTLCDVALGRNALLDTCVEALLHDGAAILTRLDLSGNNIGEGAGKVFGEWLASSSLEELNLTGNASFNANAICSLAEGMRTNTTLRVLGLGSCPVGDRGLAAIASALHENNCEISLTLSIDNCGLTSTCSGSLQELLTPGGRPVAQLLMSNNDIGADGFGAIAEMLANGSMLRVLDVAENKLDADAIGRLQRAPALGVLRLFNNRLGDASVKELCEAAGLTALEEIDLNGTGITDEGIKMLCDKLRSDSTFWPAITSVEIGGNTVTDRTVWDAACKTAREGVRIVWGEGRQQNN